jgi:glycosyltransferase involved in cell wall biosynthesis
MYAKGEWIQFLDSDDTLATDCIEIKLKESGRNNHTIICCKAKIMESCVEVGFFSSSWSRDKHTNESLIIDNTPQTASPLHKRDNLILIGGFNEDLKCAQEYDLHLRLAIELNLTFKVIDYYGVFIRIRNNSVSRSAGIWLDKSIIRVLENLYFKNNQTLTASETEAIATRIFAIARVLHHQREYELSNTVFKTGCKINENALYNVYRFKLVRIIVKYLGFHYCELIRDIILKIK